MRTIWGCVERGEGWDTPPSRQIGGKLLYPSREIVFRRQNVIWVGKEKTKILGIEILIKKTFLSVQ